MTTIHTNVSTQTHTLCTYTDTHNSHTHHMQTHTQCRYTYATPHTDDTYTIYICIYTHMIFTYYTGKHIKMYVDTINIHIQHTTHICIYTYIPHMFICTYTIHTDKACIHIIHIHTTYTNINVYSYHTYTHMHT